MVNDWRERIVADPQVMLGKPVVRGTRITVDLLVAYPRLSRDDVQAALAYAADTLRADTIFPLAA